MNMYIHKMKINFTYIFLAFILIFLIAVSMSRSCVNFVPYQYNVGTPYEGMTSDGMTPTANTLALSPAMNGGNGPIDEDTATKMLKDIMNGMTPSSNAAMSEGFTSNPSVDVTSSNYAGYKIDVFSDTPGNANCASVSSNLTNSQGPLCLNASQIQLLKTRGGNATGGDFQMGK